MIQRYELSMVPGGRVPTVGASQYDSGLRVIEFVLLDKDEQPYTVPDGSSVLCAGTKPDSHAVTVGCTYSGTVITLTLTEQMTAAAGIAPYKIKVMSGGKIIASAAFILSVEADTLDENSIMSDSDISFMQTSLDTSAANLAKSESAKKSAEQARVDTQKLLDDYSKNHETILDAAADIQKALDEYEGIMDEIDKIITEVDNKQAELKTQIANAQAALTSLIDSKSCIKQIYSGTLNTDKLSSLKTVSKSVTFSSAIDTSRAVVVIDSFVVSDHADTPMQTEVWTQPFDFNNLGKTSATYNGIYKYSGSSSTDHNCPMAYSLASTGITFTATASTNESSWNKAYGTITYRVYAF